MVGGIQWGGPWYRIQWGGIQWGGPSAGGPTDGTTNIKEQSSTKGKSQHA